MLKLSTCFVVLCWLLASIYTACALGPQRPVFAVGAKLDCRAPSVYRLVPNGMEDCFNGFFYFTDVLLMVWHSCY